MIKKRLLIAAGIILNSTQDHVFITRRHANAHQGGLWEFAGGKVETNETAEQAVIRELNEEVGIQVTALTPLINLAHDYPDRALQFDFFAITAFTGEACGNEGQAGLWVAINELEQYPFPEANAAVLAKIIEVYGK
ncbi:8-oxo-dGTP diphosphatase MutT [Photobacterium iliopiscarium]|uniref:8-oxo-dGTP diphosphatase MutT n=1 Tax=Photobacterium iliopiscarium TaxID=56192 RepID=UPI001E45642E|nr:8-oxo-dGTP diphosphatase MutT [Photobacterium iliopiscarium]MCD9486082.1 8-oxo-dGTP diphosphatase MutT [Photobacterium iliopiscarium]MCF2242733.1 8-oxo-dGTP diphosphatase MutT [Photobacterium iliopiscarium]